MDASEIEDILLQFLVTLPVNIQKAIVERKIDLLETVNEEAEEEIKEELWRLAKNAISYSRIIQTLEDVQDPEEEEAEYEVDLEDGFENEEEEEEE